MAKATAHIVMCLLLTTVLLGCEPKDRQRLRTFFFTGVPPLEETRQIEELKDQPSPEVIETKVTGSTETLFSHPLWLAGACDPCHITTGTFRVPGIPKKSVLEFKTGGGMVGKLNLPKNKICTQCHADKAPQRALAENLWLHNTTAKGDCIVCHDPHQSKNPKTLRQPLARICTFPCHEQGKFMMTPAHQTKNDCLSCHNPHMGIDKKLLTKEYKEKKTVVATVPGHPEIGRE